MKFKNLHMPSCGCNSPKPKQKSANKLEEAIGVFVDSTKVKLFAINPPRKSDTIYQIVEAAKPAFNTSKKEVHDSIADLYI